MSPINFIAAYLPLISGTALPITYTRHMYK